MKSKERHVLMTIFITSTILFVSTTYSNLFKDVFPMTEAQYARAAQEIVKGSLPLSPCATNTTITCHPK